MARKANKPKKLKRKDRDIHGLMGLEAGDSGDVTIVVGGTTSQYDPHVDAYSNTVRVHSIRDKLDSHLIAASYLRHNVDWIAGRVQNKLRGNLLKLRGRFTEQEDVMFVSLYRATEPVRTAYKASGHFHRPRIAENYAGVAGTGAALYIKDVLGRLDIDTAESNLAWRNAITSSDDLASIKFALDMLQKVKQEEPEEEEERGRPGDRPGGDEPPKEPPKEPSEDGTIEEPMVPVEPGEPGEPGEPTEPTEPEEPDNNHQELAEVLEEEKINPDNPRPSTEGSRSQPDDRDERERQRKAEKAQELLRHTYIMEPCINQQRGVLDHRVRTILSDFRDIQGRQLKRRGRPTSKAWRLGLGDTKVFTEPPKTRGELVVMVDFSSSMGNWHEGSTNGYLACQIMLAIAARHPDSKFYGFTSVSERQEDMMDRVIVNRHADPPETKLVKMGHGWKLSDTQVVEISAGNVPTHGALRLSARGSDLSQGTPMCAALNALEDLLQVKHAGSAAVFITDGEPQSSRWVESPEALGGFAEDYGCMMSYGGHHVAAIADRLHTTGTRFAVVNVGFEGAKLFPADVLQVIDTIEDLPKIREVLGWLDEVR